MTQENKVELAERKLDRKTMKESEEDNLVIRLSPRNGQMDNILKEGTRDEATTSTANRSLYKNISNRSISGTVLQDKGTSQESTQSKNNTGMKSPLYQFITFITSNPLKIMEKSSNFPPNSPHEATQPILTLFTSFSQNVTTRPIYENTWKTWSMLKPEVHPVLYCSDEECLSKWNKSGANFYGWTIHRTPKMNKDNVPVLR